MNQTFVESLSKNYCITCQLRCRFQFAVVYDLTVVECRSKHLQIVRHKASVKSIAF